MEHKLDSYDIGDTLQLEHIPGKLTLVGRDGSALVVEGEVDHAHGCALYCIYAKSEVDDEWDAHKTLVMPMYDMEAEEKGFL